MPSRSSAGGSRGRRFPSAAGRRRSRSAGSRGRAGRGGRQDRACAIMASRSSGRIASFCSGGRPWVRRMPASTVAMWRSARSNGSPRCAKFQASAESRRSIVPTEHGFRGRPRRRRRRRYRGREPADPGAGRGGPAARPGAIVAPVGGVGAAGVWRPCGAGVVAGGLGERARGAPAGRGRVAIGGRERRRAAPRGRSGGAAGSFSFGFWGLESGMILTIKSMTSDNATLSDIDMSRQARRFAAPGLAKSAVAA